MASVCLKKIQFADIGISTSLGGLLDCPLDLTRIFAALNEFEKALEQEDFQESFRTWVAPMKRSNFNSKVHLTVDDHDFIGELASSLWHDDAWVGQQYVYRRR